MSTISGNPFAIRCAKFASGERMPFLVRRADNLPIEDVTDWLTAERRVHKQARTLEADLEHLQFLYLWAETDRVDLDDRLAPGIDEDGRLFGARFFTTEEMRSLCSLCGLHLGEAVRAYTEARFLHAPEWPPSQEASVTPIPRNGKRSSSAKGLRASNLVKRNRIQTAYAFLRYLTGNHQRRLVVTGTATAEETYAARRTDCIDFLRTQYKAIGVPSAATGGKGLLPEVEARLRAVIEPDHPENPWEPPCCIGQLHRRTDPYSYSGSRDADVPRSSEFEHVVHHGYGDCYFGCLPPICLRA